MHRRTIRTESPDAQRYFDQGLNWSYAFNHDEAIRSFEQAARELDRAVAELNKAVAAETGLLYMEPPEWIQPVRHSLGAVLMSAKRWDEAAKVYRADLAEWPENGWSLYGLSQCLRALDDAGADAVEQRFRAAWSRSDTEIQATCFCVPRPARELNK